MVLLAKGYMLGRLSLSFHEAWRGLSSSAAIYGSLPKLDPSLYLFFLYGLDRRVDTSVVFIKFTRLYFIIDITFLITKSGFK